jgi:hypothetical protein
MAANTTEGPPNLAAAHSARITAGIFTVTNRNLYCTNMDS